MNRYDILAAIGVLLVFLAVSFGANKWKKDREKKITREIVREMVKPEALK